MIPEIQKQFQLNEKQILLHCHTETGLMLADAFQERLLITPSCQRSIDVGNFDENRIPNRNRWIG